VIQTKTPDSRSLLNTPCLIILTASAVTYHKYFFRNNRRVALYVEVPFNKTHFKPGGTVYEKDVFVSFMVP
jgi:hypothetical protein